MSASHTRSLALLLATQLCILLLLLTTFPLPSTSSSPSSPHPSPHLHLYRPSTPSSPHSPPLDLTLLSPAQRSAYLQQVASVPLKGWNSYDAFGGSVNETLIRAHIDIVARDLLPLGYTLVAVDAGWYSSGGKAMLLDEWGRPQVDPVRYPSAAANGFRALADYAHSKGLLFGIHTMRGTSQEAIAAKSKVLGTNYTVDELILPNSACVWWSEWYALNNSHPGSQVYYDSLYAQYADWHLDFIKATQHSPLPALIRVCSHPLTSSILISCAVPHRLRLTTDGYAHSTSRAASSLLFHLASHSPSPPMGAAPVPPPTPPRLHVRSERRARRRVRGVARHLP